MKPAVYPAGDPESVRRRLGLGALPMVDFASTANPLGPSPRAVEAAREAANRLGERFEPFCPRLTERVASHHGVSERRVVVSAGTHELISVVAQSLRDVLAFHAQAIGDMTVPLSHFVEPTSPIYRKVSARNELRGKVWGEHVLGWKQSVAPEAAAGIFWTGHPEEPTGRFWDRGKLERFVEDSKGLLTVVDESALPYLADAADRSLIDAVSKRDNLLVHRSISDFWGMPGLPVAYAVAPPDLVVRIKQYLDPHGVSPAAEAAALASLDDREYLHESVELMAREPSRLLDRIWSIAGLRPAWPDRVSPVDPSPIAPYLLVSLTQTDWDSVSLHEALARRGLLVRECSDYPGLEVGSLLTGPDQLVATQGQIRIGVRTPEENDRLVEALDELMASGPTP